MPKAKQAKTPDQAKDFNEPVKKQADLPGMENRAIAELEDAARKYAGIRDRRMALNESEVKLKALLLGLLKKHDKREYNRDGIRIWIKVEEETVKVKIEEDDDDEKGGDSAIRDNDDARGTNRKDRSATSISQGQSDRNQSEDSETREEAAAAEERSEAEPEDF